MTVDKLIIGNQELPCLFALTAEEQRLGLMWRDDPVVMAFVYNKPDIHKFWMCNTVQPLDLIFCKEGKIHTICHGSPFSLKSIGPDQPSDLIVEMPFLKSAELNINSGQNIKVFYSLKTVAKVYDNYLSNRKTS